MSPNAQVRGLDDQNVKDDHGMISPNPYSRGSFQTPVAKVPKKKKKRVKYETNRNEGRQQQRMDQKIINRVKGTHSLKKAKVSPIKNSPCK
jgi:hypothetical protein